MSTLREAFEELDLIGEEEKKNKRKFNLSNKKDVEELGDKLEDDDYNELEDIELAIDVNASIEDELQDSYVGQLLLFCPVCHAVHYRDKKEVAQNIAQGDEKVDTNLYNGGEECPVCGQTSGYLIKGQVTEYNPDEPEQEETTEPDDDLKDLERLANGDVTPDKEEKEEKVEESLDKKTLNEDGELTKSPYKNLIGKYFNYSMNFKFLDIVASALNRIDFEELNTTDSDEFFEAVNDAMDSALTYNDDQWEVVKFYYASPDELVNNDDIYLEFRDDINTLVAEIVENGVDESYEFKKCPDKLKEALNKKLKEGKKNPKAKLLYESIADADNMIDDIVEATQEAVNNGEDVDRAVAEAIDSQLIYSSDILDMAQKYGVIDDSELIERFYDELYSDVYNQIEEPEDNKETAEDLGLPEEVTYTFEDLGLKAGEYNNAELMSAIEEHLSDDYGYTVLDYGWTENEEDGNVVVDEIEWDLDESLKTKNESKLNEAPIYGLEPQNDTRKSFHGKAQVNTGDNGDKNQLYSYDTLVAEIKDGKPVVYGTYSVTTLRHIKEWLKQLGFKAESAKQIMNDYGVKNESFNKKSCGVKRGNRKSNFLEAHYNNETGEVEPDLFYGVPEVEFIWHGEWSDPEVAYKGKLYNYYDLENSLYDLFEEDIASGDVVIDATGYEPGPWNDAEQRAKDDAFADWVKEHASLVYEELESLTPTDTYEEGLKAPNKKKVMKKRAFEQCFKESIIDKSTLFSKKRVLKEAIDNDTYSKVIDAFPNINVAYDDEEPFFILSGWDEAQELQKFLAPDYKAKDEYDTRKLDEITNDKWGFADEYAACYGCGELIDYNSSRPDNYAVIDGDGVYCEQCIKENPDNYLDNLINNPRRANTCLDQEDFEKKGFEVVAGDYEHGYYGRTDDPKKILDDLLAKYPKGEFVFDAKHGRNPFAVVFQVFGRNLGKEDVNESKKTNKPVKHHKRDFVECNKNLKEDNEADNHNPELKRLIKFLVDEAVGNYTSTWLAPNKVKLIDEYSDSNSFIATITDDKLTFTDLNGKEVNSWKNVDEYEKEYFELNENLKEELQKLNAKVYYEEDGEPILVFKSIANRRGDFDAYVHNGQHTTASKDYVKSLKKANINDQKVKDLIAEYESNYPVKLNIKESVQKTGFIIHSDYLGNEIGDFYLIKDAVEKGDMDAIDSFDEDKAKAYVFATKEDANKFAKDHEFTDFDIVDLSTLKEAFPGWRHMTGSQRRNAKMDAIFDRYNKQNELMAQFLIDNGVTEDEVAELKKHSGLGGNALHQKLIELGLKNEFFNNYLKKNESLKEADDENAINYTELFEEFINSGYNYAIDKETSESVIDASYDDELDDRQIVRILDSEDPYQEFYELLDDAYYSSDAIYYQEEEILREFNQFLKSKGLEEIDYNTLQDKGLNELYYVTPDYNHYLKQETNAILMLDTGNANYDFTLDPNYYNDYGADGLGDKASIVWLAKTQGYTKEQLEEVLKGGKTDSKFLKSCYQEAIDTTSSMNTITFLCRASLKDLIEANTKGASITFTKAKSIGLFDTWHGAGGTLDIQLEKPVTIPNELIYTFTADVDKAKGVRYSADSVYGLTGRAYDADYTVSYNNQANATNEALEFKYYKLKFWANDELRDQGVADYYGRYTDVEEAKKDLDKLISDGDAVSGEIVTDDSKEEVIFGRYPEDNINDELELDESAFDKLVNKYCTRVYENVKEYKTTSASLEDNKLVLEGVLTKKNGTSKNVEFIFEKDDKDESAGVEVYVGLNEAFSSAKKAFTLRIKNENNKLITESITYRYSVKTKNGSKPLYGTIKNRTKKD